MPTLPQAHRHQTLAILLPCLLFAACASTPPLPPPPAPELTAGPRTETIYVVEAGWHTDIGLQMAQFDNRLAQLDPSFPGYHALSIGFGARPWVTHPQHSIADLLAVSAPGAGAMLVSPVRDQHHADGAFNPIASEGADEIIYGSGRVYSFGYTCKTCNTWTAEALQTAGLPVRVAGVVFASEVIDQAQRLATAPSGTEGE